MVALRSEKNTSPTRLGPRKPWELILHARLAPLAKIERLHCHHDHLLVLSAEASARDLRRYWPEVTSWFEQTRFRALEKKAESKGQRAESQK